MLLRFLCSLRENGRAELVPGEGKLEDQVRNAGSDAVEREQVDRVLREWYADAVMEFPGVAPSYHQEAAHWGAILLFRASCYLSFREIEEEEIRRGLLGEMPDGGTVEAHVSADLCLRHWPDVMRMARALSESDLLVQVMRIVAAEIPLSSLGPLSAEQKDCPVFTHPGALQLLTERALARNDHERVKDERIARLVREKLGAYTETLSRGLLPPVEMKS